ncbi:hypothetical protein N7493_004900 [Penicillium malachiteum]|uniref:Zn(2)-C6 fungal-type domain-containing protein n=1 Tax=Penicillium malachiteum TaxID=1324776 RepID=A0AAD6MW21_9EURO|nr:hypothetical protein N7493_004900 [Penicillium malachiteum]
MSDPHSSLEPPDENSVTASRRDIELPTPSKRRDKPQLSCNACRRRKVRCDRLQPCSNCSSRGNSASCKYTNTPISHGRSQHGGHVQDRINRLENLVLGSMQQSTSNTYESPFEDVQITKSPLTPQSNGLSRRSVPTCSDGEERARVARARGEMPSPSPSDQGSIHIKRSGVSYVSSAHWSAVLESIDELRDHLEQEDNGHMVSSDTIQHQASDPSPHLFYAACHLNVTPASILKCVPHGL